MHKAYTEMPDERKLDLATPYAKKVLDGTIEQIIKNPSMINKYLPRMVHVEGRDIIILPNQYIEQNTPSTITEDIQIYQKSNPLSWDRRSF